MQETWGGRAVSRRHYWQNAEPLLRERDCSHFPPFHLSVYLVIYNCVSLAGRNNKLSSKQKELTPGHHEIKQGKDGFQCLIELEVEIY